MSPEAQRIAIAEACGWSLQESPFPTVCPGKVWLRTNPMAAASTNDLLPDYLTDLNAMHEAEAHLLKVHARKYTRELSALVEPEYVEEYHYFRVISATAAQRAEAFLRTIGKWEDDK